MSAGDVLQTIVDVVDPLGAIANYTVQQQASAAPGSDVPAPSPVAQALVDDVPGAAAVAEGVGTVASDAGQAADNAVSKVEAALPSKWLIIGGGITAIVLSALAIRLAIKVGI